MNLAHLATQFVGTPLMIHPPKLEIIVRALAPRLGITIDESVLTVANDERTERLMGRYREAGSNRSFEVVNGTAIIPIQGTLMKRLSGFAAFSGGCSYMEIQDQLNEAMDDRGVNSVLLDIDSPGGQVSGCFELADAIYNLRGKKPIYAVANDCALSAAYAIASAADKVYVGRTGAVGSVGVYALHAEQAELDKRVGIKYTYVFAGKNKVDGNPHEPLADGAYASMKTEIDREYGIFTETVARNRGVAVKDVVATNADLLWADSAIPLLADKVGTIDDALAALAALTGVTTPSANASSPQGEVPMDEPNNNTQPVAAPPTIPAAATATLPVPAVTAPLPVAVAPTRSDDDIMAISNLCNLAGVPGQMGAFLTARDATGALVTVGEVSRRIQEATATAAGNTVMNNGINPNTPGSVNPMASLEAQVMSQVSRSAETEYLYVAADVKRRGTTKEQATAAALENNPEAYAKFRDQHNAKAMISALQKAGVRLA